MNNFRFFASLLKFRVKRIGFLFLLILSLFVQQTNGQTEDSRGQFNGFLKNLYFSFNPGYINYPYKSNHLYGGWTIDKIKIPHFGARILLGIQINDYFLVQYSVMRAAIWPYYNVYDGNGYLGKHNLWVNEWGFTLKAQLPFLKKNHFFLESGMGLFSRNGFGSENAPRIKDANYITLLSAIGIQRKLSQHFDATLTATYTPPNYKNNQPHTMLSSIGFIFRLGTLGPEKVKRNSNSGFIFPKQMIQIGGASNVFGFLPNDLFSYSNEFKGIPIFWRGELEVESGFAINYQKNIYHGRKRFSMDWGLSASIWQTSIKKDQFFALSVFPVLRFWFLRTKPLDFYFVYAIVGPTYISKVVMDNRNTGKHFTYQDFLGIGSFIGKERKYNLELKIEHYSNGNIFAQNPGIDVPLMLNFGRTF